VAGMAGTANLGDFAEAVGFRAQESALIQELKAGSEDAYAWLVGEFHQPVYSLVYRVLTDPADAADTTQDVFLKVFRGMKHFHGESSLKTWIYRIAIHEASNRRRWWFRHKSKETPVDQTPSGSEYGWPSEPAATLMDRHKSPFETVADHEVQARVEQELRNVPEPYRTAVVLRDIEDLSYEQIAEITQVSLGTVKSRITRGRDALRKLLADYVREVGPELGFSSQSEASCEDSERGRIEVVP
jgi:RNA polymerase sigma-70 factor, ECF subfamily